MELSNREIRVLGCLLEKQLTTPDYYPLTLKALTAACNQKSSRNPVMALSEGEVGSVLHDLRREGLVTALTGGRADRFEQQISRKLKLDSKERAVMSVLMLRGALTLNEIRTYTGRMVTFDDAQALQQVLTALMEREEPLVRQLARAPGQREARVVHLLGTDAEPEGAAEANDPVAADGDLNARVARLEQEVAQLRAQVEALVGA